MTTTRRNRDDLIDVREQRLYHCADMEMREAQDNPDEYILTGYASTFEPYEMYGGPSNGVGWIEQLSRKAFDRTLRESPDLHLLINHEGMPLARTKSGTLKLSVDNGGLKVEARLDRSDPDVQRLEPKMRRHDMDEMSFAFRVKKQKWEAHSDFPEDDQSQRTIEELSLHKGDVSVVNFGANPTTHAEIKGIPDMLKAIARCDMSELAEVRADTDLVRTVVEKLMPEKKVAIGDGKGEEKAIAVSDAMWSVFTQSDFTPEQWRSACLLDTGEGEDLKARYRLPVREPGGTLNRNGVYAMAFKMQDLDMSDEQRSAAARKLIGFYRDFKEDPPEYLVGIAEHVPDADFFDPPERGMPLRDALVPPTRRGMSLRDAQRRMGILPEDGSLLSLSEATGHVNTP